MLESKLKRRQFLKISTLTGGAVLFQFSLMGCQSRKLDVNLKQYQHDATVLVPQAGPIVFTCPRTEMGQGISTGLAAVFCEELDYPLAELVVKNAPAKREFNHAEYQLQLTGGSSSLRTSWQQLRMVGAELKAMFILGAAQKWQLDATQCIAKDGCVMTRDQSQKASYQSLIAFASIQEPDDVRLKTPEQFQLIGKQFNRVDGMAKVLGSATYGIDVDTQNGYSALVIHSPVLGGTVASFDSTKAGAIKGFVKAVKISRGLAIVANKYWQAKQAAQLITIQWQEGPHANFDSEQARRQYIDQLTQTGDSIDDKGDWEQAFNQAPTKLNASYSVPFLAHATMEPMNCTARYDDNGCEIWAPTQGPGIARAIAADMSGHAESDITVHCTYVGGGFGRRVSQDYVAETLEIAMALPGKAIKNIWTRESDIKNDVYRPMANCHFKAALDDRGNPIAYFTRIATQAVISQVAPQLMQAITPSWFPDSLARGVGGMVGYFMKGDNAMEGAETLHYDIPNFAIEWVETELPVPVGYWRSVGHSQNAFFVESFIDEIAHAAKQDPYQFRRKLLAKQPRFLPVLDRVATMAGWGKKKDVIQGIAIHLSFGSIVAQIVEIAPKPDRYQIVAVYCAIECGLAIYPDAIRAQMESSIVFGLSAALSGRIDFVNGRVKQNNFHDYPVLRAHETPNIEVDIIPSTEDPQGVGEPGLPPIAPALANALFAASGHRQRELPLSLKL